MRIRNKILTTGCIAVSAAALLSGVSCNEHEMAPFSKSLNSSEKQLTDFGSTRKVDILFIIDDSLSMSEEQALLDKNFNLFLSALADANADFRLGTVSTSYTDSISSKDPPFIVNALSRNCADSQYNNPNAKDGKTVLLEDANSMKEDKEKLDASAINAIVAKCANYYSENKMWLDSTDDVFVSARQKGMNDEERKKAYVAELQDYFRCQAMIGTCGDPIERGLGTMLKGLYYQNGAFKRPDSILTIVFVTDENDCTNLVTLPNNKSEYSKFSEAHTAFDYNPTTKPYNTQLCEIERRIEDSCLMTSEDSIETMEDNSSKLISSSGITVNYTSMFQGEQGTADSYLRTLCVKGDAESVGYLETVKNAKCANTADCPFSCEDDSACKNESSRLNARSEFYNRVIQYVIDSNKALYDENTRIKKCRAEENQVNCPDPSDDAKCYSPDEYRIYTYTNTNKQQMTANVPKSVKDIKEELARADVIVANIINRDRGVRYNTSDYNSNPDAIEKWCGNFGMQSYRYQLFAEMFGNDPIYAPICCKREEFKMSNVSVCERQAMGSNSEFGPVLGAIGTRIGKALNTMCTSTAPVTCKPSDCNEPNDDGSYGGTTKPRTNPSTSCPCAHGCNGSITYFSGNVNTTIAATREYNLCNEFSLTVGSAVINKETGKLEDYKQYCSNATPKNEYDKSLSCTNYEYSHLSYTVDYESTYCANRTASPIQINLGASEAEHYLIVEYPKKISGQKSE